MLKFLFIYVTLLLTFLFSSDGFLFSHYHPLRTTHHVLHIKIDYRNAQCSDIEGIATLCAEIFDGPFPWHQPLARTKSIGEYKSQFSDRLLRLVDGGIKHAMVVAVTEDTNVIGFLEVGMLPCPVEPTVVHEQPISNTVASSSSSASIWEDVAKAQSQSRNNRNDVPYLGNVAVLETYRRQGVGQKLVRIGMKIAEKWKENDVW
jgi:ribosomal protein S18 acetylase RimI-like enzyme